MGAGGRRLFLHRVVGQLALRPAFVRSGLLLVEGVRRRVLDEFRPLFGLPTDGCRRLPVAELITHRLPLGDAQEGFRLVARAGESLKVVLTP